MLLLNGTPINDLIKQVLCLDETTHRVPERDEKEVQFKFGDIQLLFDRSAISKALDDVLPENVTPDEMFHEIMKMHISSNRLHEIDEEKLTEFIELAPYLRENNKIFPEADTSGTTKINLRYKKPSLEILKEMGISSDKAIFHQAHLQQTGRDLKLISSERAEVPDYPTNQEDEIDLFQPNAKIVNGAYAYWLVSDNECAVDPLTRTISFLFGDGKTNPLNNFKEVLSEVLEDEYGYAPKDLMYPKDGYQVEAILNNSSEGYARMRMQFDDDSLFHRTIEAFSMQRVYENCLDRTFDRAHQSPTGETLSM